MDHLFDASLWDQNNGDYILSYCLFRAVSVQPNDNDLLGHRSRCDVPTKTQDTLNRQLNLLCEQRSGRIPNKHTLEKESYTINMNVAIFLNAYFGLHKTKIAHVCWNVLYHSICFWSRTVPTSQPIPCDCFHCLRSKGDSALNYHIFNNEEKAFR